MKTLKVYTAEWCVPCKQYKKVLNDLKMQDANVVTIDVDAWKDEARNQNIRSIPTTVILENDTELIRVQGILTKEKLEYLLTKDYGFTS